MEFVISFLPVNLNSHLTFFALFCSHSMNDFSCHDNIITNLSTWNEAALVRANQTRKKRFYSISNHLHDGFVYHCAETNRSELGNASGNINLGYED